ncbi:MAG: response regulator [Chloroflexia bacterium]|nr:response regulator [Chloroflexia bacterium]MDQ3411648.1 response regulator [Chloroflexota bacterium]
MTLSAGRIASDVAGHPAPKRTAGTASPAILVVDDEPYIVDVIAFLLEDEGFRVLRAYDGEQAWGIVSTRCPDLIISDVYMPRLNGLDFLKRLQQRPPLSYIPVILMSAARRDLIVPNAAFVAKPFDLDRMLSLVNAALATR